MTVEFIDPPPAAALANLTYRMRTAPDGSTWFADDQGQPILDTSRDGCPPADGRAAAAWLRSHNPSLWSETVPTTPVAAQAPQTAGDFMVAVREGRMTATEASTAIARLAGSTTTAGHVPTSAATSPHNFTAAMIAAKAGDSTAIDALMKNSLTR